MKNLIYVLALLVSGSVMAQQKPKEVKEETKVKVIKTKDNEQTTEKKVKVITRETADVELNKDDEKKINQNRIKTTKKVEKMVMIDGDSDSKYDVLTKETYFVSGDGNYKFTPSSTGFDIVFDKDNNKFINIGKAWSTSANGNYIIRGKMQNGIGYFDQKGNFVIEYFDENSKSVKKRPTANKTKK